MKIAGIVLIGVLMLSGGSDTNTSRETRELQGAEQAVMSSLILAKSRETKYLCTQSPHACLGPEKAELGLMIIGVRDSAPSNDALARLVRMSMDAGLSTDYTCYVLNRGKKMKPRLRSLDLQKLHDDCRREFDQLTRNGTKYPDVTVGDVCADPKSMSSRINLLLEGIQTGESCGPDEF